MRTSHLALLKSATILLVFGLFVAGVEATLHLHFPNGTTTSINCWSIVFQGNTRDFEKFNGTVYPASGPVSGQILSYQYRGGNNPITEIALSNLADKYHPRAVIIFHNSGQAITSGDQMQFIDFVPRVDSTKITFPVVSIDPAESSLLREWLAANGPINVTIDSEADYYTTRFKYSGFYHAFAVVVVSWACINAIMAAWKLFRVGMHRNIASVCLGLEIAANLTRILFGVDPFGGWEMMPIGFVRVVITTSVPISIAAMLLFTFYWQELVSGTLVMSPFLTRSKVPAAIVVTCLMILEIISSSLRGAEVTWNTLATVTGALYAVVMLLTSIHFVYVSAKVLQFARKLTNVGPRHKILREVTIRCVFAVFGMLTFIAGSVVAATGFGATAVGTGTSLFMSLNSCNWIGTTLIVAFHPEHRTGSKSKSSTQATEKDISKSQGSGSQSVV